MTTDKLIQVIMALVVAYLLFHLGRFSCDFVAHGLFQKSLYCPTLSF